MITKDIKRLRKSLKEYNKPVVMKYISNGLLSIVYNNRVEEYKLIKKYSEKDLNEDRTKEDKWSKNWEIDFLKEIEAWY